MSTMAPSRLNDVSPLASFQDRTADKAAILAGGIAERVAIVNGWR
jgi:hypothetical protein